MEAGVPHVSFELNKDYTPLEIGLNAAVSGEKGCYTGQEVLARQITYDKVTQILCGLKLESEIAPGSRIWLGGRAVGKLTSVVYSPRYDWVGLAVIRRRHLTAETELIVGNTAEAGIPARIVQLPFS